MGDPNKTKYYVDERTINDGTTDLIVDLGTIRVVRDVIATNLDTGNDITIKLNAVGNSSRTIRAGKSLVLNDEFVTSMYLSNSSGGAVNFSVMITGG